jgi:hypothetical protein
MTTISEWKYPILLDVEFHDNFRACILCSLMMCSSIVIVASANYDRQ